MPDSPPAQRSTLPSIEQEELRVISRTVAEIEWLLLILVLVYVVFGRPIPDIEPALSMALFFFAAFVMSFRYTNFYKRETRWKIAVETLAMIVFITWVLWFTGGLASPLLNAYLLVVITSALTLGKTVTLAEVALIGACFLFLGWAVGDRGVIRHTRDGGRTWTQVPTPHGDNHGMWFNPDNPDIIVQSNDGGANVSLDRGRSWSTIYNQPTSQFYHLATDDQFPYRIYSSQQDSGTVAMVARAVGSEVVVDGRGRLERFRARGR